MNLHTFPPREPHARPGTAGVCLLALLLLAPAARLEADGDVQFADAFVRQSSDGRRWEIGNQAFSYTLGLDEADALEVLSLARADRPSVLEPGRGDATLTVDDNRSLVGDRAFRFLGAESSVAGGRVLLTLGFSLRDRSVVVERHYLVAPGTPIVEMWSTVEAAADTTLRDLNSLAVEVRARDLWWQRGHDTPDAEGGAFSRRTAHLDDGQHQEFGSPVLSSQESLPWFGFTTGGQRILAGIAWSGAWRASVDGTPAGTRLDVGLRNMSVVARAGQRLELPRAFLGVTGDGPGEDAKAFGAWIASRREGRPFPAFVTYNTWFTLGIDIDDTVIRRQMDSFADIGGELFQLDAGWYPRADARNKFDFGAGLGSWQVDAARFPEGLGVLADHAHARGLRFGVWVEPERVAMSTVGRPGLARERYLAMQDGQIQPGHANAAATHGQICLADGEAWTWLRDRLFAFLDQARPDYLKIDLNGWLVCTRTDHDHTRDGGSFGHVQGLYRLLAALRERYPAMDIENCSGGGRRLDAEMLTRADAHWMDDRSAPAARVRHHLELLSSVAPPAALLSYLMTHEDEPMLGGDDLPLLARSRMPGVLGLAVDFRGLGEFEHNQLGGVIAQFKGLRALRGAPFTALLTDPVGIDGGGPGWDVMEQVNPVTGVVTLFAFRNAHGERRMHVTLTHLEPALTYRIRSLDHGPLGQASADDLMTRGFDIDASSRSASHVFVFEPQ